MAHTIIALEKDLFFSVRIRDTLRPYEIEVLTARSLEIFQQRLNQEPQPEMVIINFSIQGVDWEQAIRAARQANLPVLAFGSHIDIEAHTRARNAGAQRVVANSKFTRDLVDLVQSMLTHPVHDAGSQAAIEE